MERIDRFFHKLRSLWELSLSLSRARFILRHEGSLLGIFWYLLNPFAMFLILLFLGHLIQRTAIDYYPAYLFLGLILFNFFGQATSGSISSITSHGGILKAFKIDQEPFVIAGVLQAVISHLFEIVILAALLLYFKIPLSGLLFYPLILFFLILFIIGFSFVLATIRAYVSDLENVWRIIIQLAWFAAPVYYIVPKAHPPFLNKFNPMFYFMDNAREIVIYNRLPNMKWVLIMCGCSVAAFVLGLFIFEKFKHKFAEVV